MANFVQGTCEQFCPEQEVKLRVKEKLLHYYEYKNGQKHVAGTLVKCFARSAAGIKSPKPKDLRTERCLQQTVQYLLKEIVMKKEKPYNVTYDFIFDRLRAVRQEMVIQNYNAQQTIALLEPIIMFIAFSRYKLCEESIDNFDTKICDQHLQECLKRVLCCYDELADRIEAWKLNELRNCVFVEALYQLFNLGSTEALSRAIALPPQIRDEQLFKTTFDIALNYHQGNLYRVAVGVRQLPHVLCAIAALKIPIIRRRIFQIFSYAYNNKLQTVPLEFLLKLTLHRTANDLLKDCEFYNIKVSADRKAVHFVKSDFDVNGNGELKMRHEDFVEDKLKRIYLPEVLLLKKLY